MQPDADKLAVKDFKEPEIMTVPNDDKRSFDLKRWKIIGAVVVLVTLFVIGGIITTIYLTGHMINKNRVEKTVFLKDTKEPTREKVSVDKDEQTEDLQLENKKLRVIHDFKKGLSMYQTTEDGESVCVVTSLERSHVQRPSSMYNALQNEEGSDDVQTAELGNATNLSEEEQKDDASYLYNYEQKEVEDRTIFPLKMREACADSKMYWAVKSDKKDIESDSDSDREKRALIRRCWCFRIIYRRRYGSIIRIYYRFLCRCIWIRITGK